MKTRELMLHGDVADWRWESMTEMMMGAAKEVCRETTRPVANPWTVGCEDELDEMREDIMRAVRTKGVRLATENEVRDMEEDREERMHVERERES